MQVRTHANLLLASPCLDPVFLVGEFNFSVEYEATQYIYRYFVGELRESVQCDCVNNIRAARKSSSKLGVQDDQDPVHPCLDSIRIEPV
jgi:hypothetical protein